MAWRISAFGKLAPMKKQDGGHRAPRPSAMATSKERRKLGSLSSLHSPIRSDVETVIESRAAADWIRGAEGLHQYDYLAEPSDFGAFGSKTNRILLRTKFWVGAASLLGYRLHSRHSGAGSARAVEIHGKQNQGDAAKGRGAGNRGS